MMWRAFFLLCFLATHSVAASEDSSRVTLSIEDILARADSVSKLSDSILAHTKYRFESFSVFNRVGKDGKVKSSDTTIAIVTKLGAEEISQEIVYSSNGSGDGKKSGKEEKEISLSFENPNYNFSLTEFDDLSYKISVVPVSEPPKEGDYVGTMEIDRQSFFLKRIDLEVPDPEGPLREFSIEMSFKPLEGGLVVPSDMRMRGFVKALFGILKIRFTGESRFTNYEILE